MTDIGAGFHKRRLCSRHEYCTPKYPHKKMYLHASGHIWCLGQLTRFHQLYDLVGRCYRFTPGFQCVLNGETLILHAKSVIDHVKQASQQDPDLMELFPLHIPGTYVALWSMMDIAAYASDECNIRPLTEHEVEAFEEVAKALLIVISPIVILPPDSNQVDFVVEAARQLDLNIDTIVRKL